MATKLWIGALLCGIVGAACAGSASESPWPVEPINTEPGPAGERPKQGLDPSELPNRYGQGGGAEESEDALEERAREREEKERGNDAERVRKHQRSRPNNDPMRGRSPMVP